MQVTADGRRLLRLEVRNAATPIEGKPPWIKTRLRTGPEYGALHELVAAEGYTPSVRRPVAQTFTSVGRTAKPPFSLASLGRFALHRGDRKLRGPVAVANRAGRRWLSSKAADGSCWRVFRSTPVALCCL